MKMKHFMDLIGDLEHRDRVLRGLTGHIKDADRIIDIATGSGYLIRNLLDRRVKVFCIDIEPKELFKLKNELVQREKDAVVYYICADARKLPVKDSFLNVAVSWSALVHIKDWKAVTDEMFRVMRQNGTFLATEPFGEYAVRAFRDFRCEHDPPSVEDLIVEVGRHGTIKVEYSRFIAILVGKKIYMDPLLRKNLKKEE